jgi:glycosyltransferase involved in cell wall biosynthesis
VESHRTGFWVDQTPEAVAAGVNAVLSDRSAARDMGCRGRSLVASQYSWPHAASALINTYKAVAADTVQLG